MTLSWKTVGAALAFAMAPVAASAQTIEGPQTSEEWFEAGQATVKSAERLKAIVKGAKNVILFVGDGMGVSTVTAARILEGQLRGKAGEENSLFFEKFPYLALSKTYNTNQQTPDSAGTMTAMMTGVKTKAGMISMDPSVARQGNCNANDELPTLLEQTADAGMNVGVVSTARLTHATPAATYAHTTERDWEKDQDVINAGTNCVSIASQLVAFAKNHTHTLNVALGGGDNEFSPANESDWPGTVVKTAADLAATNSGSAPVLGLFSGSHMAYEYDRANDASTTQPSLSTMTEKAIQLLKGNRKGFFLHVESGRIDHAHHASNAFRALTEAIEFAKAIKKAAAMTNPKDTLIIVTADHSHVFTVAGYPTRGNNILGKVVENDSSGAPAGLANDALGLPYTTLGYQNGPGYIGASNSQPEGPKTSPHFGDGYQPISNGMLRDLSGTDTTNPDYLQEAAVPLGSETHAAEDVAIYAAGPMAHLFQGTVEQNVIYHVMREALKGTLSHHGYHGHHRRFGHNWHW